MGRSTGGGVLWSRGGERMGGQTSVVLGILRKSSDPFPVSVLVRLWRCSVGQLAATQALCRSCPEQPRGQGCRRRQPG